MKKAARELFGIMQEFEGGELTAVKRKFSTPKYFEVSKYKVEKVKKN